MATRPGLSRSGGRHRFRQASSPPVQARRFAATFPVSPPPAFIHARRTGPSKCSCPFLRRQPARLRSALIRITPLLFATPTNCKKKQPPPKIPGSGRCRSTFQAVFSVERPLAWSVKKIIAVAPAALAVRPGSSFSRRQPARLRPAPIRITPRRSLLAQTAKRSRHRT